MIRVGFFLVIVGFFASPGFVLAGGGPWSGDRTSRVRLVVPNSNAENSEFIDFGIHFRLAKGWKTYWRHAGEAGVPPRMDWSQSRNLVDFQVRWPAPKRFHAFGYDSFGYVDEVILPVRARRQAEGATLLDLTLEYLVCKDVCVPQRVTLIGNPAQLAANDDGSAAKLQFFRGQVPSASGGGAGRILSVHLEGASGEQTLTIVARSKHGFFEPDAMVEAARGITFSRPRIKITDRRQQTELRLSVNDNRRIRTTLAGQEINVTIVDGDVSFEKRLTLAPGS